MRLPWQTTPYTCLRRATAVKATTPHMASVSLTPANRFVESLGDVVPHVPAMASKDGS